MELRLQLEMLAQPDETTCGPTCLHAVYQYFGDNIALDQVIQEVPHLEGGGTLAVYMACHALRRGYQAKIYTSNVQLFDPSWFEPGVDDIPARLEAQMLAKRNAKLGLATRGYIEFLDLGGKLAFEDLNTALIRKYINRNIPLLTGLSATYLYRCKREIGPHMHYDDILGEPTGHFVVLSGYDRQDRSVVVADPLLPNPVAKTNYYSVGVDRLLCSILLGILTYDDNLLVITPKASLKSRSAHR